ncbi:MAG: serine/threonine-protein kinase [Myxococcota bacterium]
MLVDRYFVEELIGSGSCGLVFRARDRAGGTLVALKEFSRASSRLDNGFLRELGFMFDLEHPNIVACHSVFMSQGHRYLVLEYVGGGSLRDALGPDGFNLRQALRYLLHACRGVAHAHQRNIIHRDLKPENILLADDSGRRRAKVADFGVATLGTATTAQMGVGSPAYMAPEQFYTRSDVRADVYALGVMAYEIICGCRPFVGTPHQVMNAHLHQPVVLPRWLPGLTRRCLRRVLAKEPERRHQSVGELRAELSEILALEGEVLARVGWPVPVGRPDQLLVTNDRTLVRQGSTLWSLDDRGRLVESLGHVSHVAARENYHLRYHEARWCLVSPMGRRTIPGIPFSERVGLSATGDVICVSDGGAILAQGRTYEVIHPAGSGAVDACFSGHRQEPYVVGVAGQRGWLDRGGHRQELPGRPARVYGHSDHEQVVVRSLDDPSVLWCIRSTRLSVHRVACGELTCGARGFVAAGADGAMVTISLEQDQVERRWQDVPLRMVAASSRNTVWLGDDGGLRLSSERQGRAARRGEC